MGADSESRHHPFDIDLFASFRRGLAMGMSRGGRIPPGCRGGFCLSSFVFASSFLLCLCWSLCSRVFHSNSAQAFASAHTFLHTGSGVAAISDSNVSQTELPLKEHVCSSRQPPVSRRTSGSSGDRCCQPKQCCPGSRCQVVVAHSSCFRTGVNKFKAQCERIG